MTPARRPGPRTTKRASGQGGQRSFVAKIAPPAGAKPYPRERLFRLLDLARHDSKVTWVGGPAGAGKTTLVASYAESRELRCIWYQADAGDRDPATFFHYLGLAVAHAAPRFRRPLPKLTPEYFEGTRIFARNFFRELGRRVRPPFVMILDNLQELDGDTQFHEVLLAGLGELPPGGHAYLISRAEPPAVYARLRTNRELSELDWQSLRLREDESHALARHLCEGSGSAHPDAAEALHRRCEGWVAGLILLLELGSEIGGRPREAPTARSQTLFDYFAAEVFAQRPPAVRDFLLLTALFPTLTGSMAARLTGHARAEALLGDLCRQHHFTERRSDATDVYQYHSLFREFLLAQALGRFGPAEMAHQQRRAAVILEQEGRFEDATPLYLAAGDSAAAIRLIRARAESLAAFGRYVTLAALIDALPVSDRDRDPWLRYWRGLARASSAPVEARADLAAAYAMFDAADDAIGLYSVWAAIVESFFTEYRGYRSVDPWIAAFESLRRRHPQFPSAQVELRVLWAAIGVLHQRHMEHPSLPSLAARLEELIAAVEDADHRVLLGAHSLLYYVGLGRVDRARRLWELIRRGASRPDVEPLVRAMWCMSAALLEWSFGDARTCLRCVDEGLALVDRYGLPPVLRLSFMYQGVYGALAGGDAYAASCYLQAVGVVAIGGNSAHAAIYRHCAAMIAAHRGDFRTAELDAAASVDAAEDGGVAQGHLINLYTHANVALLGGNRVDGARLLAAAYAIAAAKGSRYVEFLCRFSEGAFGLDEDRPAALSALRKALALSREMEGPAIPWLPHRVLARAYVAALAAGIETEHVRQLITKLDVAPTDEALLVDAWPWPIKIYTLGRFGVAKDGVPLKFSAKAQKKPLDLLKVLIASGGRSVREERILDVLWPNADAHHATFALTTTVHRLRKLIGQKAIERRAGRITLNAGVCWVDAWSLERVLATAERTCRTAPPEAIEALADNVSALYRGGFLSDHDEEAWLLTTRERIRDKLLRVLGFAAEALVGARRHEQAVRCLQRSLEIEPLAEGTYRRLMQAHLAREQRSEALAAYRRCRKMLAAHYGVEPSPDTEALRLRIQAS